MSHSTRLFSYLFVCVSLTIVCSTSIFADDDNKQGKGAGDVLKRVGERVKLTDKADSLRFKIPHPTAKDTAAFVAIYRGLANEGLPWAAYEMGEAYGLGWAMPKDTVEAYKWYCKAADMEDNRAMRSVGVAKLQGWGTSPDTVGGLEWLAKSSKLGNVQAASYLGELYYFGDTYTETDDSLAVVYLAIAADSGDVKSQKHLADIYADDFSSEYDETMAFKWAEYLADKGEKMYQRRVGAYYLLGMGVDSSASKAGTYLYKAAMQNDSVSEYVLAELYYLGIGAKQDYVQSKAWLTKATAHCGSCDQEELLTFSTDELTDSLNTYMTQAQKDSAVSVTPEWHAFSQFDAMREEVKRKQDEQIKAGKTRKGAPADTASASTNDSTQTRPSRPSRKPR